MTGKLKHLHFLGNVFSRKEKEKEKEFGANEFNVGTIYIPVALLVPQIFSDGNCQICTSEDYEMTQDRQRLNVNFHFTSQGTLSRHGLFPMHLILSCTIA